MTGLSRRGRRLLDESGLPGYLAAHFERSAAPPGDPPYLPLCVAENRLVWDLLAAKARAPRIVPAEAFAYDTMTGSLGLRGRVGALFEERIVGRPIPPEQVAILAGAGSVLEVLFYALADPGDGVLVPTPGYPGFWLDLETRDELEVIPVPGSVEDDFRVRIEALDAALEAAPCPVRALLLCSPDNPSGRVLAPSELGAIVTWTERRGLHLVSDEIYALSVFGDRPFTSVGALREQFGPHVHLVWGFSKDFAANGLRAGVLVSENPDVLAAVDALAYWCCCSGDTQALLESMLSDASWLSAFLAGNRSRLAVAYGATTGALDRAGIEWLPAGAGFFVLCDLRSFLTGASWEAEEELWGLLLERTGVNLTPGRALRSPIPGYFRLCFAAAPTEEVVAGIERVAEVLRRLR